MSRSNRLILLLLAATLLSACGSSSSQEASSEQAADVSFSVDPDLTGDAYENTLLGLRIRPPAEWMPLSSNQRDAVGQSLIDRQLQSEYRLELQDVFVHPPSLSFFAVSLVQHEGEVLGQLDEYVEELTAQVAEEDDEVASSAVFEIDGLTVHQFRFLRAERINFTLVVAGSANQVAQLDYSIPLEAYEAEGIKLESSIGSMQRLE